MGLRAGLDAVEEKNLLPLLGIKFWFLSHLAVALGYIA
jgi:hypothetical protein